MAGLGRMVLLGAGIVWLGTAAIAGHAQDPTRTIQIHAKQFEFVPAEITIKKGETVKLALWSDDVPHSLAVNGLPIHSEMVKDHENDVVVTPTETGDFQGKCSKFCGSGHRDMHFVVHVVN